MTRRNQYHPSEILLLKLATMFGIKNLVGDKLSLIAESFKGPNVTILHRFLLTRDDRIDWLRVPYLSMEMVSLLLAKGPSLIHKMGLSLQTTVHCMACRIPLPCNETVGNLSQTGLFPARRPLPGQSDIMISRDGGENLARRYLRILSLLVKAVADQMSIRC